jgi:uncharacterized protein (TIGR03792 family)
MFIEWLKFKINEENREFFIQKDEQIWTPMQSKYGGFLGKEVWFNFQNTSELVIIVYWENRELWQSIPQEDIKKTEKEFDLILKGIKYEILESLQYQVRKSPHNQSKKI